MVSPPWGGGAGPEGRDGAQRCWASFVRGAALWPEEGSRPVRVLANVVAAWQFCLLNSPGGTSAPARPAPPWDTREEEAPRNRISRPPLRHVPGPPGTSCLHWGRHGQGLSSSCLEIFWCPWKVCPAGTQNTRLEAAELTVWPWAGGPSSLSRSPRLPPRR